MYYTLSLLAVLLCATVQHAKSRTITISINMSLTMYVERQRELLETYQPKLQQEQARPGLNAAVLRSCMRETELSIAELHRFRLSLLTRDPELSSTDDPSTELPNLYDMEEDDLASEETKLGGNLYEPQLGINEASNNALDYEDPLTIRSDGKSDESLQCFAYCLYEQLGLISKGVYMGEELFAKLCAIVGRERHLVKECMNLNTNNKCESLYKMHLCYVRLKTLEEEARIRKVLGSAYPGERDEAGGEDMPEAETTQETYAVEETETTQSTYADAENAKTEKFGVKKLMKQLRKKLKLIESDEQLREFLQDWNEA
ncbi:PREDICTED: uncharacterized protein LOC108966162 [Bactrocera latifrons]|uniref:uncharacterized protein LOC108966162 n=1 Tax=Bactrocera latifrons TaxID=174628 RepID=UPI0008DE17A3|nr:PREDICTED: uncharacterized protein LOC108966162 [Bactrocera latifrons]